jgi:hypothetical protein
MTPETSIRLWPVAALVLLTAAGCAAESERLPEQARELQTPQPARWDALEPGLDLGVFPSPRPSEFGDSMIRALRIDPGHFEFQLLNTSASPEGRILTAREWCRRHDLVAAINTSMYQRDFRTSVSLMRTRTHTNNPRLSKDMTILAFDRLNADVPPVKIIDRECDDFEEWKGNYGTLIQSIRMLSCGGENVWSQQPRKWSTAAIGTDRQGRVLFLHVRSPYSTHDLIEILRELPLDLDRAMYAEGGPEAQLYIHSGGRELELVGSYESAFQEDDENSHAWPVPNVVGIRRR